MALKGIKLSYSPSQFRVRAELDLTDLRSLQEGVGEALEKCRTKLKAVANEGKIAGFVTYPQRLQEVLQNLKSMQKPQRGAKLSVLLGGGFPKLAGLEIKGSPDKSNVFCITINAQRNQVAQWRLEWVRAFVDKTLEDLKITGPYNSAQLEAAFQLAKLGRPIQGLGISSIAPYRSQGDGGALKIVANKSRGEVYFVVFSVQQVLHPGFIKSQIAHLEKSLARLPVEDGYSYRLLPNSIQDCLDSARLGPEFFGVDLPLVILAALAVPEVKTGSAPKAQQSLKGDGDIVLEDGKIVIRVSQKGMQAVIDHFDVDLYQKKKIDIEWLTKAFDHIGIVFGRSKGSHRSLLELVSRQHDLTGTVIAQGKQAYVAAEPYLHPVYKDRGAGHASDNEKNVNMRDAQQQNIVKAGQLVAEIRYRKQEVVGCDIFGNRIRPGEPERLKVNASDDIEVRNGNQFFAKKDGAPKVTRNNVSIQHIYVHHGDVNLTTGNIYFDGPVRILGSIDKGAVVETGGDLEVAGSIRSGLVRAAGKIKVEEGIITGGEGIVTAETEIQAEFIENSTVECSGTIRTRKAIVNSTIRCHGPLEVRDEQGVIAGGSITSYESISTGFLGFRSGNVTRIKVGVDWKAEYQVEKMQKRIETVEVIQAKDRADLREILGRPQNQLTKRHHELKEKYQKKLQKATVLVEKLKERLQQAQEKLRYNNASVAFVRETLYPNVQASVAGRSIPILKEIGGVVLSRKKRRGTHIHPIDQFRKKDFEEDLEDAG